MAAWRRLGAIRLRRCGRIGLRPSALNKPTAADDVVVVAVEIQDGNGDGCPLADNLVTFDVQGPAQILGVGNGNPVSHEPDKAPGVSRAVHGLAQFERRSGDGPVNCISEGVGHSSDPPVRLADLRNPVFMCLNAGPLAKVKNSSPLQ